MTRRALTTRLVAARVYTVAKVGSAWALYADGAYLCRAAGTTKASALADAASRRVSDLDAVEFEAFAQARREREVRARLAVRAERRARQFTFAF